jgi:tetratricopeptide (TPR) repeat protein
MAEKSLNDLPADLRKLFTKGTDASSRENYDYAITLFNQILTREPAVYDVRKALRSAQLKKAGGGGGLLKKMWSTASSQPQVTKAQMALRKDPGEALQIAEQVLANDAQNTFAHRVVVEACMALEMPKTAVLSLDILMANSPKDRELAIKFANALADSGDVGRAERILADLAADFPQDQDLALALKNISARKTMEKGGYEALAEGKGSYRDILKDKDEAVALEQQNRQVQTEDVTERLIREGEARIKAEPGNLKQLRNLAEMYTSKGQFDKALSYYEKIKETDAGAADTSVDKAITETMSRKFDSLIGQLDNTSPDYAQQVAKIQADKQSFRLSERQKLVERFPTDLQLRFDLAQLLFELGKINEAIPEFQKAQQNANRKVKAMSFLGQCYASKNMNELAVRTFEAALKEKVAWDEEKKELTYNLGSILEKLGRRDDAKRQFEEIYGVDSGYRDVAKKMDGYYGEPAA